MISTFKKILLGIFFTNLLIIPSVFSQDKEVYDLFDVSLEELLNIGMVSASKKKQSVLDAPASAYVVTDEQITLRGYTHIIDLLEDIPEIEIQKNSFFKHSQLL